MSKTAFKALPKSKDKAKMPRIDGAQVACLKRIMKLKSSGKLSKFAANRLARLERNAPEKVAAWETSYGISQSHVRVRMR